MSTLNELVYYCKETNFFGALMLTGQWGCGKTYLIEHELAKELGDEYIIIRVSLFGESSIESINRKVQKVYFQNVMLHMGSYVENIVQRLPGVTDEKASELAAKTDKITETVSGMATKVDGSKLGGVVRFVAGIAKKIPGAEKILSVSPSEFVSVENTVGDKKVILVFDDLERSNINEVDVLGCINEYCENKHIKTIIVANEDKIPESGSKKNKESEIDISNEPEKPVQGSVSKIKYSEIKEKIITRTVKYLPNFEKIIGQIIEDFNADEPEYQQFLAEEKLTLIRVFNSGESDNIRSIKCAIQDFQRVFLKFRKEGLADDLEKYFQSFVAFMLEYKAGRIKKSDKYGYILSNYEVEKAYPGFFKNSYMLSSVQQWIVAGEWDEDKIKEEIDQKIASRIAMEPKDLVRNTDLIGLDEDTITAGLPEVAKLAYNGELSIDEYITLIRNVMWARSISYTLPVEIDMDKLEVGVRKQLDILCASDEPDSKVRSMIHPNNIVQLTDKEKYIYQVISDFRDNNLQMFAINRRRFINALKSGIISNLYDCENKRYNIFDLEMATSIAECYKDLSNAERQTVYGIFKKMWENCYNSPDLILEKSVLGFEELKRLLTGNQMREKQDGFSLKAALSEMLIQFIDTTINKIKEKVQSNN